MRPSPTARRDEVRLVEAWIEDAEGERIENVEHGEPIRIHAGSRRP